MKNKNKKRNFPKTKKKYRKKHIEVFFEFIVLLFLIPTFFTLSTLVGFGYLFTFFVSVYKGTIFKRKNVARFIVFGSILTYISGAIILYGFKKQGDSILFLIIIFIGIIVWYNGLKLKWKGK